METRYSYILVHRDGYFIDLYTEPTTKIMQAIRMTRKDDLNNWLHGMYGPEDPENFKFGRIKTTYEMELIEDVDSEGTTESN